MNSDNVFLSSSKYLQKSCKFTGDNFSEQSEGVCGDITILITYRDAKICKFQIVRVVASTSVGDRHYISVQLANFFGPLSRIRENEDRFVMAVLDCFEKAHNRSIKQWFKDWGPEFRTIGIYVDF
jgi:hypothetical protein